MPFWIRIQNTDLDPGKKIGFLSFVPNWYRILFIKVPYLWYFIKSNLVVSFFNAFFPREVSKAYLDLPSICCVSKF